MRFADQGELVLELLLSRTAIEPVPHFLHGSAKGSVQLRLDGRLDARAIALAVTLVGDHPEPPI